MSDADLATVAKHLELLEETLIYRFLDRIQFAYYAPLYQQEFLTKRLEAHESMDLQFGRYDVAEEFPFTLPEKTARGQPALQASHNILSPLGGAPKFYSTLPLLLEILRKISQCAAIEQHYLAFLVQHCRQVNDRQYGSALEHDVMVLQAISRRIHYGALHVAEIKFCQQESVLKPLLKVLQRLQAGSEEATQLQQQILEHISRPEVEQRILERVYYKASLIQEPSRHTESGLSSTLERCYLAPEALRRFYAQCIIPLTKQGELQYLLLRI